MRAVMAQKMNVFAYVASSPLPIAGLTKNGCNALIAKDGHMKIVLGENCNTSVIIVFRIKLILSIFILSVPFRKMIYFVKF